MSLQDFIHQFILLNKRAPLYATELLDHLQKMYAGEEISVVEYKNLFRELNKRRGQKAAMFILENIVTINSKAL